MPLSVDFPKYSYKLKIRRILFGTWRFARGLVAQRAPPSASWAGRGVRFLPVGMESVGHPWAQLPGSKGCLTPAAPFLPHPFPERESCSAAGTFPGIPVSLLACVPSSVSALCRPTARSLVRVSLCFLLEPRTLAAIRLAKSRRKKRRFLFQSKESEWWPRGLLPRVPCEARDPS